MSSPEAIFKIIEDNKCPLYKLGDEFILTGKALLLDQKSEKSFITTAVIKIPSEKPTCRILIGDITAVLIKYESLNTVNRCVINCSGCSGLIRLEYRREMRASGGKDDTEISAMAKLLGNFSMFRTLDEDDIKALIHFLRLKKFPKGVSIIKKGDPASNLYILGSGSVEVLVEENVSIGYLERGDVFGEISLLIGTPVGATIRVVEPVTVLFIKGKDFKKVLTKFPSLQMYFARLLAQRLARTNVERFEDITSGMIGKLSDMPPSELLQTLNLNQKTGLLTLSLAKGSAELAFKEGLLVSAQYSGKEGRDAFFDILKERDGRFKFTPYLPQEKMQNPEVGDFMWLLMEGLRRKDEE